MRGTLSTALCELNPGGIIPAYAGNTRQTAGEGQEGWDHPRVCGEHDIDRPAPFRVRGSSPRMRGTHDGRFSAIKQVGIIPAYAGNTSLFHILIA